MAVWEFSVAGKICWGGQFFSYLEEKPWEKYWNLDFFCSFEKVWEKLSHKNDMRGHF